MKIVYFFCIDSTKDKVGPAAFEACRKLLPLVETDIQIDGMAALRHVDVDGNIYFFVPTREVVSHDYDQYLPIMNGHFGDFDLAGIVNWHEGGNAPDPIFCAHSTGDIPSGTFGPADPKLTTAVAVAMDRTRAEAGLDKWSVLPEATHFSGIQYGANPQVITEYAVPMIDIEIGSSPKSWAHETAIEVMARSLARVIECVNDNAVSIMFVGGTHFEPSLHNAVINQNGDDRFAYSHVLANQWVAAGDYQGEAGIAKLRAAVRSIRGGIQGLVFHEGLRGAFKDAVRSLGAELGVAVIKHKRLRDGVAALQA